MTGAAVEPMVHPGKIGPSEVEPGVAEVAGAHHGPLGGPIELTVGGRSDDEILAVAGSRVRSLPPKPGEVVDRLGDPVVIPRVDVKRWSADGIGGGEQIELPPPGVVGSVSGEGLPVGRRAGNPQVHRGQGQGPPGGGKVDRR